MLGIRLNLQLGHVCYEIDLRLNIPFNLLHDFLTEVSYIKELTSYGSINVFSKEESSWI